MPPPSSRTAAANAQIGIAVSAFYPTIDLTGQGGFESKHGGTWIPGAQRRRCGPLVRRPRNCSSTPRSAARLLTRRSTSTRPRSPPHKGVIFLAFEDVEDQLSGLRILEQESGAEERAVNSAQHSYDISNQRYKGGVTSYLEVLTAEATLIQNQQTAINLQTRQFVASVGLVRSLGGGWDTTQLPK